MKDGNENPEKTAFPVNLGFSDIELTQITLAVERRSPELLPGLRWLILGRQLSVALFTPEVCQSPTPVQLEEILAILEDEELVHLEQRMRVLAERNLRDRAEQNLAYLATFESEEWNHPAKILSRPWHLEILLAVCNERIGRSRGPERDKLMGIAQKLRRACDLEVRAARRRAKRGSKDSGH